MVLVAGLVIVGPSKLLELSRGAGEAAGKTGAGGANKWGTGLRLIPEEFRRGLEDREIEAQGCKARRMADIGDADTDGGGGR